MLVIGYGFGVRAERRLCEEVHLNLAGRWFCRPGLEDRIPDHSTFSKNRHGPFCDSETSPIGPARVPAAVVERISMFPRQVLESPALKQAFLDRGATAVWSSPQ